MKTLNSSSSIALPKPVGIWIRVSTEDQANGDSPEHHRIRAKSYATAKGMHWTPSMDARKWWPRSSLTGDIAPVTVPLFSDSTVERLIKDTTAKGVHIGNYARQVTKGKGKGVAFKPEHEWVYTPVPAIITEALWQQCNDMLETRKQKWFKPGKRPVHLFAGLAVCACGQKMYVPSNTPKYVCMACRNKIPIVDLEGFCMDELQHYLLSPEKVAAYLQGAHGTIADKTRQMDTLKKELEKVKAESDRTYALYHEGGMTAIETRVRDLTPGK